MATTFAGPEAVGLYRLVVMRSAIKLEAKGIRVTRGRKWMPVAKRELCLARNASLDDVLAALDAEIEHQRSLIPDGAITES